MKESKDFKNIQDSLNLILQEQRRIHERLDKLEDRATPEDEKRQKANETLSEYILNLLNEILFKHDLNCASQAILNNPKLERINYDVARMAFKKHIETKNNLKNWVSWRKALFNKNEDKVIEIALENKFFRRLLFGFEFSTKYMKSLFRVSPRIIEKLILEEVEEMKISNNRTNERTDVTFLVSLYNEGSKYEKVYESFLIEFINKHNQIINREKRFSYLKNHLSRISYIDQDFNRKINKTIPIVAQNIYKDKPNQTVDKFLFLLIFPLVFFVFIIGFIKNTYNYIAYEEDPIRRHFPRSQTKKMTLVQFLQYNLGYVSYTFLWNKKIQKGKNLIEYK